MITRGQNFKSVPINIVGSSTFGRYPKISIEKTYNMFMSDNWLVPYAGYQIAVPSSMFGNGLVGRAVYASSKLGRLVVVIDSNVYLVNLFFDQNLARTFDSTATLINPGTPLQTNTGVVYIAENNKPQILISDSVNLYLYDPTLSPTFRVVTGLQFTPGYITFHDTYFLCAARQDNFYSPPATNTWRLSGQNDGLTWLNNAASIGLIQTKPDAIQAVLRFPSKGNAILVIGSVVSEPWFDTGAQLFPYQRNNQYNIDYGCLNPATIAYMDSFAVWLAQNEKSGPIIVYSTDGCTINKITTDGIDYLMSQLTTPQDSQGFLYRQDGHLIYHINFYTDNLSLFYDFNTEKFFHASDENLNYFIAAQVAFFNNQYYFVSKNFGSLFAFDTIYTDYSTQNDSAGNPILKEIPRFRTCKNIRLPSQEYRIINDIGFTIESGETNYQQQILGGDALWLTQDDDFVITQGNSVFLVTQDNNFIETQDQLDVLIAQNTDSIDFDFIKFQNNQNTGFGTLSLPRVDLSFSYDGGATFGHDMPYVLNPIGQRKNKLMWWQCGIANDAVPLFKFWGIGRFVATDGIANMRQ